MQDHFVSFFLTLSYCETKKDLWVSLGIDLIFLVHFSWSVENI